MERTLDGGKLLAGLGALLLLVALFLDWYGIAGAVRDDLAITAWTAFELVDLLLAALAVAVLASVAVAIMRRSELPAMPEWIETVAGPVALVVVATSLVNKPPAVQEASLETGAWVALAGAALICAGALLRSARVSLVVAPREHGSRPPRRPGRGASRPAEPTHPADPPPADATPPHDPPPETETLPRR